jgi:DNA processing protein
VSVPGSGISDSILYPARNKRLAHRILQSGGALLSEFAPDFRATPWSFPARNRIMAGMSHAVLVIEAERRSGTLITSKLATEYNRDVLTVPGSIFASQSAGPHMLIRLGATPVTSSVDVLEALGFDIDDAEEKVLPELSADEKKIYDRLAEPCTRHELIAQCNIPASAANILISLLELKGVITEYDGLIRRT